MKRPFLPTPRDGEVLMVSECDGVFVVEPMQFLYPGQARAKAKRLRRQAKSRTGKSYRMADQERHSKAGV